VRCAPRRGHQRDMLGCMPDVLSREPHCLSTRCVPVPLSLSLRDKDGQRRIFPSRSCLPPVPLGHQKERRTSKITSGGTQKVCAACRTAAEYRGRAVRLPPSRVSTTACGASTPSTTVAVSRQCGLPGLADAPDAGSVEALMHAHLQRKRPEDISTVFSNGRTRTYKLFRVSIESVVSPRQDRRRRAMAAGVMSRAISADPSTVIAAVATILCRAKAHRGRAVAALRSLSVREQLRFKVSNGISGVTWSRFRALFALAVSGMATGQTLRAATAVASADPANAVSTTGDGTFLMSPTAAVQAMVDNLVVNE